MKQDEYECKECGSYFQPKRTDQKFCNDNCRWTWNNRESKKKYLVFKEPMKKIQRNYRILLKYLELGHVRKDELNMEGFNFDYFTSLKHDENGKTHITICDISLAPSADGGLGRFDLIRA